MWEGRGYNLNPPPSEPHCVNASETGTRPIGCTSEYAVGVDEEMEVEEDVQGDVVRGDKHMAMEMSVKLRLKTQALTLLRAS